MDQAVRVTVERWTVDNENIVYSHTVSAVSWQIFANRPIPPNIDRY